MLKKLLSLFGLGRKRATLIVGVIPGRRMCGTLRAFDADGRELLGGPVSVAARCDDALARRHGNPAHDVLRPYGDPPCGTYLLIAIDSLAGAPESLREKSATANSSSSRVKATPRERKRVGACCSACTAGASERTIACVRPRAACASAKAIWRKSCAWSRAQANGASNCARRRPGCFLAR
jgi:hypothetical protein